MCAIHPKLENKSVSAYQEEWTKNSKNSIVGKNDGFRRTWNLGEYQIKAQIREMEKQSKLEKNAEKINATETEKEKYDYLKARSYLVDLEKSLGKSFVVNKTAGVMGDGGYYCDVCDCSIKDSLNFLDHINGRKHQANLGVSMKVERSTLDQVKNRIKMISEKKKEESKNVVKEYDIDESITQNSIELKQEREKRKEERKNRKRQLKKDIEEFEAGENGDEIFEKMGFNSFGSKK